MNKELFLIDLISERKTITAEMKQMYKKRILLLIMLIFFSYLLFFTINKEFYHSFSNQMMHILYLYRLEKLSLFYQFFGRCLILIFSLLILKTLFDWFRVSKNFSTWIDKQTEDIANLIIIAENTHYYYFVDNRELTETPKKKRIFIKSIKEISLSENETTLLIGKTPSILGFYQTHLLLKPTGDIENTAYPVVDWKKRSIKLLLGSFAFLLAANIFYLFKPASMDDVRNSQANILSETESSEPKVENEEILTAKNDIKIDHKSELQMDYYFDTDNRLIFQTTDYGTTWQEIPISLEAMRFGAYTLTSGTIPEGYFMDYTHDISPDFSWYLFAQKNNNENLDLNFLSSVDNGQHWQNHSVVTNIDEQTRYRKLQSLPNGQLFIITSSPSYGSQENIYFYQSNDQGKTWQENFSTTIDGPLQNASFISQMTGFIATREKLYYTSNMGSSFEESQIYVPEDYTSVGLDIFTSPNNVTQKSANTLSIQLNLVKKSGVDIGKFFECEFISTDSGATWHFEKQIKQID